MFKRIIAFLFLVQFFVSESNVCAQKDNYKEGFAITNIGDTLFGEIKDFVSEERSCRYIKFRSKDGSISRYSLNDIKYYKRGEDVYVKKPYDKDLLNYYNDSVFMKVIDTGTVNLYKLNFLTNMDKSPYDYGMFMTYSTPYHDYYIEKKNTPLYRVPKDDYLKDIAWMFVDNYLIFNKIIDNKYKYEEIDKLVKEYNYFKQISTK